jgi:hypothetical protein
MKRALPLLIVAACGSKSAPPAENVVMNMDQEGQGGQSTFLPAGDYLCWGGFHEYLCTVVIEGGERRVAKVGGSDRYTGTLTVSDGNLHLVGQRDDGTRLDLLYTEQPDGSWRAQLPPEVRYESDYYTIRYMGEPGSVFGSQTYGGGYD